MKKLVPIAIFLLSSPILSQTLCENGMAGNYPCFGVRLMSHVSAQDLGAEEKDGIFVNDIWGWTDPETGKEYALVGMANGTSFVDVSDPLNPIVLGILKEHNWNIPRATKPTNNTNAKLSHLEAKSIWRDIKVYQHYAYIGSEDRDHGIQVFDLHNLRTVTNAPVEFEEAGHYAGVGQSHNLHINEDTGFLYAVGFTQNDRTCASGGLHIVDLADPLNPVYAGCFDTDGYTHDTQCVIYAGNDSAYQGREICFSSNEDTITITDVTDKNAPVIISQISYQGVEYVHQGWLTEDHRYFLSNDELDEYRAQHNTRTYIWDFDDLDNPQRIGTFNHVTAAIDHNLYVKGHLVYESNYTSGLRVLNLKNIAQGQLTENYYFDTYPANNSTIFKGTWSNYPFFESGNIIVSDITGGLFVLRLEPIVFRSQPSAQTTCVGEEIEFTIDVIGQNLTYQWQADFGDGFKNIPNESSEPFELIEPNKLKITQVTNEMNGVKFRCNVSDSNENQLSSDEFSLTVLQLAQASFELSYPQPKRAAFTNTSTNSTNYHWTFGDGTFSNLANPIHDFPDYASYEVQLVASNVCSSDTYSLLLNVVTSVNDVNPLKLYPNPAKENLWIERPTDASTSIVSIISLDGRVVLQTEMKAEKTTLSLNEIPSGMYLVRIHNGNTTHVVRLLISH